MSTKNTPNEPVQNAGTSPASPVQDSCTTLIRITDVKCRVGNLICARGAEVCVTASQAEGLVRMGKAVIVGVK